jgi:hypothetical protein
VESAAQTRLDHRDVMVLCPPVALASQPRDCLGTEVSIAVTLLMLIAVGAGPASAEEGAPPSPSAEEIAAQLANPNATLGFLAFPIDFVQYQGSALDADDQSAWKLGFQPSIPYPLNESTNLFVRPLIPVFVDQPVPVIGGESIPPGDASAADFSSTGWQLGDISFDAAIGKTFDNGMVLFAGVVGTLPTATDNRVGLDQYLLGPEFFIGRGAEWGFLGILLTHQSDVAGTEQYDTSITGGQYFYTVNLKNAWQIQAQPTFSYNHEAESGNRWTVPLGVGISKTSVFGTTPWKFSLQVWKYVVSPDTFGPDYQIRFQITPVVPLPW